MMNKFIMIVCVFFLVACGSTPVKEPTPFTPKEGQKMRPVGCDNLIKEIKEYNKKHGTSIVPNC